MLSANQATGALSANQASPLSLAPYDQHSHCVRSPASARHNSVKLCAAKLITSSLPFCVACRELVLGPSLVYAWWHYQVQSSLDLQASSFRLILGGIRTPFHKLTPKVRPLFFELAKLKKEIMKHLSPFLLRFVSRDICRQKIFKCVIVTRNHLLVHVGVSTVK